MSLDLLEKELGYRFQRENLLLLALTHPSAGGESTTADNQRLEFLGDAVLQLAVSDRLYQMYPDRDEGFLSHKRAALVQEKALSTLARALHLGENLILSHGERTQGGRERNSNLADAAEAVLGAVYLDGGFESARQVIYSLWEHLENAAEPDYKSELQEMTQAGGGEAPVYEIIHAEGPDHDRRFTAVCVLAGRTIGQAVGRSKKEAQQFAAREGIRLLEKEKDSRKKKAGKPGKAGQEEKPDCV
ncbi:MAG: ribonuclease III [Clostridia bacterium]|nr:ribonuclease III [Clostridia bacterium]